MDNFCHALHISQNFHITINYIKFCYVDLSILVFILTIKAHSSFLCWKISVNSMVNDVKKGTKPEDILKDIIGIGKVNHPAGEGKNDQDSSYVTYQPYH